MEKQQTAVQKLREKYYNNPHSKIEELFEEAERLERQQIEEAVSEAAKMGYDGYIQLASDYYTKKYGS